MLDFSFSNFTLSINTYNLRAGIVKEKYLLRFFAFSCHCLCAVLAQSDAVAVTSSG